ncbi:HtrA protease/chaperone protein [Klebsiella grimontii]|uniref:HtrA protease/chaperone protein n=1 Tax=Klebsiella grimontii TaxID=2058152 RepID=A0A7H4P9X4_9ENTR|nr:HtrA protease/chaperone protein [Klebsiella grimontii]
MKKTTLAMSALALSLGLALSPLSASAAETASSATNAQQMPSLAPMLEKVMPSVVSINVEGSTTVNTPRMRVTSSSSLAIIRRSVRMVLRSKALRSVRAAGRAARRVAMAASSRNLWPSVPG